MDSYGYEKGKCFCCHKETDVRWKNLYVIGSEGMNICIECERKVLDFCRELSREAFREYKNNILKRKQDNG